MNKFAMASKKLLLFVISGLFILSIASSIAYLLTQELIVAATSVTFESTQSNTAYNGVDEVIENFNIDADANFAVVTVVYRQSPSAEVVTYVDVNAQEASFGCRESDADYAVELWYVANPSTGSVPVNVVWSGATNDIVINVTSFSGVDTTNPVRSSACASSQGVWSNTASVTIASNPDDLVFGAWNGYLGFVFAGNSTPNAGTTEIWEEGNVNTFTNGGYRESTSASETVSWTYTGDPTPWAIAAISIVPQAVVSNDFNVSLIDNTDSFQITATRTSGTATVSALEYRVNGGSWVSLDDSGGGGFGTSSATSGLVDKQTLGAPGNYTVDYRALGSDGLYYPQPAGFGTQTVNVPNPPTYEDIQVLNVFTEAYPYAAAGYPINSSQPLDPDDNATYAILAVAHRMDAGQTVTSASWGGVNFTQLASCESDDYSIDLWGLANPNVGSNGGDIQFSSDATEVISALTFLGNVDTTNPIYAAGCEDTQDNNALWSNNPSITLTSKNGYYMFGAWNGYLGFISNSTPNSGTTEIWEEGNINTFTNGGYRESTSTSDTLSWTYTGDPTPWAIAAVVLKPTESTGSGSGEIDLNVSVDNSGGNFQITANATGSLTVSSLEYSYDGGNTWNAIPDSFSSLVSGGYGTSSVVYQVDNYAIPDAGLDEFDNPQYYPVSVRAIDNNDNVWPASGYVEVLDIDGLGNGIEFVLYKNENGSVDDGLGFSVRHLAGVNISSVEYRIDSGSWVNYESSQVGSTEVEGGLFFVDLPTGNHTFQVRATDENGVLWPLQNLYSFAQISFDEGLYEGPRVLSDLDFNSSVGEFAINSGEFISTNVTDDQVLPSEQGVYKWVDVVGSTGGRVRISDSTFTNDGSAGALTFDGFGDDSSIETITTETKVYVPENFNFTNNLYLTFEFTWHDNFVSNFEAQEQNGNKLYLDIDGVLYEIFDFYANGSGQTGVTQQINIDLDQALASAGYTESDYLLSSSDPYLLFRIESSFAREAQDKNGTEGFTIDNFRIYHSFDGTISEDSLPKLSMDANLFRSAKRADIYSGIVNERLFVVGSDEISGTALDEDSSISSIRLELYGQDDLLLNTILATPVDGAFDSSTEIYEIVLDDTNLVENGPSESVSKYALAKIIVEDAVGNTNFYEFTQGFSYLSSDSLNLLVGSSDRRTVGINEVYDVRFVVEKEVTNQDPLVSFVASTDLQFDFCSFSVDFGYNFEPANVIDSADGDTCEVDFSILDFDKYAGEIILRFTLAPESFDQPTISGVFTILTLNGQQAIYDTTAGAPINSNQFEPTFILNNLGVQPINQNQVTYTGTAYGNEDYGFTVANVQYAIWTGFYEVNWTDAIPSDGSFNEYEEDFYFQTPPLIDGEKIVFIRVFGSNGVEFYSGILGDVGAPADRVNIDAVDTSTPIIELQPVLPNPTADSSPIISGSVGDDESELTSNIALIEYSTNGVDFTPITPADGLYDEKEEQFKFKLEDLAPGDYQVWVRARDASGNVTAGDQIKSVSFTVIERQEVDAVKVSKQSDFNSYIDYDSVLSENVIWGRGQLRLKEDVSVASKNLLVPTNNGRWGNRYKRDAGSQLGFEYSSCGNGLFLNQAGPNFAYYDLNTNTEYQFDLTDVGLASSDFTQGMASFQTPSGDCHLWLGTLYNRVVAINFGTSIADGIDEYTVYDFTADTQLKEVDAITIDDRNPANYGVMLQYPRWDGSGGTKYINPGASISSQADDTVVDYFATAEYNFNDTQTLTLSTSPKSYGWWFADYSAGIVRYNDNGTPLNKTDDTFTFYDRNTDVRFGGNFGIAFNKDDQVIFAGNHGVSMIYDYNGTFDASDDLITTIASAAEMKQTELSAITYYPGDDIIGEQIWVTGRGGEIVYISTNNTPTEKRDDVIDIIDYASRVYPAQIGTFVQRDVDSFTIFTFDGIHDVTMNIEFEPQGTAVTKIYSDLEGNYLDVDYIELVSTNFKYNPELTSFRVSNDGGFTWQPIELGQKVNFVNPGYRFALAIDMFRGSTPVLTEFQLEYSAYPSEDQRGLVLDVDEEPDVVPSGTPFSFEVDALDDLLNPLEDDQIIYLELRNVETDEVAEDFNIESILVPSGSGSVDIPNAVSSVLGTYYIYATNGTAYATSDPILFVGPSEEVNPPGSSVTSQPTLVFTASDYEIYEGETTILSWQTSNLNEVILSSDNNIDNLSLGSVNLNDTLEVKLTKTTTFTLRGTGAYGDLESKLTIVVLPKGQTVDEVCELPEIKFFNVEVVEEMQDNAKVKIVWEVENVENVTISGLGDDIKRLAPKGEFETYVTKDAEVKIIANNRCGEAVGTQSVNVRLGLEVNPSSFGPLAVAALVAMFGTLSMTPLSGTYLLDSIQKFGVLFGIVLRKKKKYWGFIYDLKNNKGIPFAIVNVYAGDTLIKHEVTDLDGKYGVLLDNSGEYRIEVKASGYKVFDKNIRVSNVGDTVEIVEDIGLIREDSKFSLLALRNYYKPSIIRALIWLMAISMAVGFVYTVIITTQYPNAVNYLLLAIYGILFTLNIIHLASLYARTAGKVLEVDGNKELPGVSVRFYRENKQVGVYLTNSKGEIKVKLQPGKYWYIANKNGYIMADSVENQIPVIEIDERGFLTKDILMKKNLAEVGSLADIVEVKTLQNPFGAKE